MHPNLRDVGLTVATESSVRFAGFVVVPLFAGFGAKANSDLRIIEEGIRRVLEL